VRRSVVVRPAVAADLPAIAAIYAAEVREGVATYELDPPDAAQMQARWQALQAQGYPYLVAEVDGAVGGYAHASSYRAREGYRWTVEDTVYVAAGFQRAGVGRALLEQLLRDCTALGFRQMIAVIGDRTNLASVALHERLGFVVAGVFPGLGRKHGRWLDAVQMQRPLGDGASAPPPGGA